MTEDVYGGGPGTITARCEFGHDASLDDIVADVIDACRDLGLIVGPEITYGIDAGVMRMLRRNDHQWFAEFGTDQIDVTLGAVIASDAMLSASRPEEIRPGSYQLAVTADGDPAYYGVRILAKLNPTSASWFEITGADREWRPRFNYAALTDDEKAAMSERITSDMLRARDVSDAAAEVQRVLAKRSRRG